jgi:hypothetical protein
MGELTEQFDYERVTELVPKDDRDFEREYKEPAEKDDASKLHELWDRINDEIEQINKEYAVINLSGNAAVLNEVVKPTTNQPDVEFSRISDFHHFFANQLVQNPAKGKGQKERVSISKLWFASPSRREFKGVVFNPDANKKFDGYYNLYRGLAVKPKKGDWSLMDQHIKEVIANNFSPVYYYIKAWLAQMVQEPGGQRPGVALVLRGGQGVGKGIFATNFGMIFGSHFIHIQNQKHLTGNFNQHLKDKLLVFVDEGFWAGDKSQAGVLRGLITEDKIIIEPKGVNAFDIDNHMRFIIASNNSWVVPAGLDERRMFVLDVSSKYQRDYDYFKALVGQMDNGGREAMLYDLLEYDYHSVNLREFPRTEALLDQMLRSASITHRFWFEKLMEGCLMPGETYWTGNVSTDLFYNECIEFSKKIGLKYASDKRQFGKDLKHVCPTMKKVRPVLSDGTRQHEYMFPGLDECRIRFEQRINMEVDWNEPYDQ